MPSRYTSSTPASDSDSDASNYSGILLSIIPSPPPPPFHFHQASWAFAVQSPHSPHLFSRCGASVLERSSTIVQMGVPVILLRLFGLVSSRERSSEPMFAQIHGQEILAANVCQPFIFFADEFAPRGKKRKVSGSCQTYAVRTNESGRVRTPDDIDAKRAKKSAPLPPSPSPRTRRYSRRLLHSSDLSLLVRSRPYVCLPTFFPFSLNFPMQPSLVFG
jgi:hypothetical protein